MPADENVTDVDWLAHAGSNGWPVLMKDERIRYRPAEKEAVIAFKVQGFCLTSGNLKAAVMADQFLGRNVDPARRDERQQASHARRGARVTVAPLRFS